METVIQADVARLSNSYILLRWWQVTPDTVMQIANSATQMLNAPTDSGRCLLAHEVGAGFFNRGQITEALMSRDLVEIEVVDLPQLHRDSPLVRLKRNLTLSAAATNFMGCIHRRAVQVGLLVAA